MEISEAYRFCPACGVKRDAYATARPFRCSACGHTSFFGPVTAVGAVVLNEHGQVLLIERAKDPGKGKLGMPGGFVDPNEAAEVALRREIREEVGIEVEDFAFLMTAPNSYSYQGIVNPVLDIFFQTNIKAGQSILAESSEVSSWMWTDLNEEVLSNMAFASNRQALDFYLTTQKHNA
jgi:ADP-ribose pyrophosphatase